MGERGVRPWVGTVYMYIIRTCMSWVVFMFLEWERNYKTLEVIFQPWPCGNVNVPSYYSHYSLSPFLPSDTASVLIAILSNKSHKEHRVYLLELQTMEAV